jgi:hypothetical protein
MKKLNCPHCGKPGISLLRKAVAMQPELAATCTACGKRVGVPLTSRLVTMLIFLPGTFIYIADPTAPKLGLALSCLAASIFIHLRWAPLEAMRGGDKSSRGDFPGEDAGEAGAPETDSPEDG